MLHQGPWPPGTEVDSYPVDFYCFSNAPTRHHTTSKKFKKSLLSNLWIYYYQTTSSSIEGYFESSSNSWMRMVHIDGRSLCPRLFQGWFSGLNQFHRLNPQTLVMVHVSIHMERKVPNIPASPNSLNFCCIGCFKLKIICQDILSIHCREEGYNGKYIPQGARDFPRVGILHPEEISRMCDWYLPLGLYQEILSQEQYPCYQWIPRNTSPRCYEYSIF